MQLPLLDPLHPVFPPSSTAAIEPNGLLAGGGNLAVETLLQAYRQGVFPWFEEGQPILWWSPDPRAVLYPKAIHISRSLAKSLRHDDYDIRIDTAFEQVVHACAAPRRSDVNGQNPNNDHSDNRSETWIVPDMIAAYCRLFSAGYAHSVECWKDEKLVGGLYGLAIGGIFCGESMFSRASNASKLALVHLARALDKAGFRFIDCQIANPHLDSMGATDIARPTFLDILTREAKKDICWPDAAIFATVAQSFRAQ